MTAIAFIGLGNMGTPMAQRLLAAGHTVRGFDLAEPARARLTEAGGTSFGDEQCSRTVGLVVGEEGNGVGFGEGRKHGVGVVM